VDLVVPLEGAIVCFETGRSRRWENKEVVGVENDVENFCSEVVVLAVVVSAKNARGSRSPLITGGFVDSGTAGNDDVSLICRCC
jgi:hypothetical protein